MSERESSFAARIAWCREQGAEITSEAERTVSNATVVPCGNGGLQLEMHSGGIDMEIEIAADGSVENVYVGMEWLQEQRRKNPPASFAGCLPDGTKERDEG